jgi:transposase
MPAKNHLNPKQIEKLQKALREEEKAKIREKNQILLLLNDGKTQSKIADFLGCSLNKVSYWCLKGDPDNLESLIEERMKGSYKKATNKYIDILLENIEKTPQELGDNFG